MSQNKLKIEAESLDLELSGDADYVVRAYEAIREVLIERFEATLAKGEASRSGSGKSGPVRAGMMEPCPDTTSPLHRVESASKNPLVQHVKAGRELTRFHLQFVVCTELYYRVAALTRNEFEESIFGDVINSEHISKLYVDESAAECLRDRIEFGSTLWRELTKAGKLAIHGDSS